MQLTRIEKENGAYFSDLIPEEILSDKNLISLGVIDDEQEASAACAFGINADMAEIRWLYTDPDKRNKGAATYLLTGVTFLLKDFGLIGIEAAFSDGFSELEDFLAGQGFLVGTDSGSYAVPLSDLIYGSQIEYIQERTPPNKNVRLLLEVGPSPEYKKYMDEHGLDLAIFTGISPSYSVIAKDESGVPMGGLFVSEMNGKDFFVNYLLGDGTVKTLCEMFCVFYKTLIRNGKDQGYLFFTERTDNVITLVEYLTGMDREMYRIPGKRYAISLFA